MGIGSASLALRTTCFRLPSGGAIEALIFKPPLNFNSSTNDEYTTKPPLAANEC